MTTNNGTTPQMDDTAPEIKGMVRKVITTRYKKKNGEIVTRQYIRYKPKHVKKKYSYRWKTKMRVTLKRQIAEIKDGETLEKIEEMINKLMSPTDEK